MIRSHPIDLLYNSLLKVFETDLFVLITSMINIDPFYSQENVIEKIEHFICSEDFEVLLDKAFEKGRSEAEFLADFRRYLFKLDEFRYRGLSSKMETYLKISYENEIYEWLSRVIKKDRKALKLENKSELEHLFSIVE